MFNVIKKEQAMIDKLLRDNLQNFLKGIIKGHVPVVFMKEDASSLYVNSTLNVSAQWHSYAELLIRCDQDFVIHSSKPFYVTTMQDKELTVIERNKRSREILIAKVPSVSIPKTVFELTTNKDFANLPINDWLPMEVYKQLGSKNLTVEYAKSLLFCLNERPIEKEKLDSFKRHVKMMPKCLFTDLEVIVELLKKYMGGQEDGNYYI